MSIPTETRYVLSCAHGRCSACLGAHIDGEPVTPEQYADLVDQWDEDWGPEPEIAAEEVEVPTIDLTTLPRITTVEIYEDNAGGLWFRPVGQGIVIEMQQDGDALTDCRTYGTEWDAAGCEAHVYPEADVLAGDPTHIATYRAATDALTVEVQPHTLGKAAMAYIAPDASDLVPCRSADGWSLHAPGSTDDEIASGDAPPLSSGRWADGEDGDSAIPEAGYADAIYALLRAGTR